MGSFGLYMVHGAWFHPIDENPVKHHKRRI
jgi:hypothetical protein